MSDVQSDINESQAVQAALSATNEAQVAVASIATPGNDSLAVQPVASAEPATKPPVDPEPEVKEPVAQAKANSGAALSEQRAAFKVGSAQAGNAMDTMHGKVNATWPPKAR